MKNDHVEQRFPGSPETLIEDSEWDDAERWLKSYPNLTDEELTLDRRNPNRSCYFSPYRGNRAYLRVQLRRRIRLSTKRT